MCGRYVIARAAGDLMADVDAAPGEHFQGEDLDELRANWNVAPTTEVPIVLERLDDGQVLRELHVARWGLVPSWAKEISVGARMFNARSETAAEKPSFRAAVKKRRCAIPANGYYEWRKRLGPDGKPAKGTKDAPAKQPYFIHPPSESENIWFAGLYEWWQDPQGQWILSCSILTAESPDPDSDDETLAELAAIHDRIPVAMNRDALDAWLDPSVDDKDGAQALIERVVAQHETVAATWELRPVGQAVGSVRNNSPELVEPLTALF
ncbi:SOS response-associated peptidase [Kocuria palustris]|uniref:SOS response-associated peptidase n=1 Tax=Kocuria palustris TaxID=71999 RepID=UPI00077B6E1E|nr:SOS response-associated peptidase [Kocuria palustris]